VAGYNYGITYKNKQGDTSVFKVYVDLSGNITVNSASVTPASQVPIPVPTTPTLPGAAQVLTKAQY